MRRLYSKFGSFLLLALLTSGDAVAEKYAVLIGSGDYVFAQTVTPLPKAAQDANDMHDALKKVGWVGINRPSGPNVMTREVTRFSIMSMLNQAKLKIKPDDDFLLFFAGHGVRDVESPGSTPDYYWLMHLTRLEALADRGILFRDFMRLVEQIPAKRKLILLDHCFGGQVVPAPSTGPAVAGRANETGQQFTLQRPSRSNISNPIQGNKLLPAIGSGTVIIAADRDYAFETDTNGIFTSVLLSAFGSDKAAGNDGILSLDELEDYVRVQVEAEGDRLDLPQKPVINGDYRNLNEWQIAINVPKGDNIGPLIPLAELQQICEEWKTETKILPLHFIDCKRAVTYKQDLEASSGAYSIDPEKEIMHKRFQDYALAVRQDAELKDELLQDLCETLQSLKGKEKIECTG